MLQPYLSMAYFSTDGIRAAFVLLFAISQAVMAYWPDIRGWKYTITKRSQDLDTLVVPFGPFFAIWIVIFLSCIAFAIWHGLPTNLNNPTLRAVGWIAALLFAGNTLWEYHVVKRGLDWGSVGIIAIELLIAIMLVLILSAQASDATHWLSSAPLYFYAGWTSVAAFTNLSSTLILRGSRLNPRRTRDAAFLIAIATILITALAYFSQSWFYVGAASWGILGIVIGAYTKQNKTLIVWASLSLVIVLAVTAFT